MNPDLSRRKTAIPKIMNDDLSQSICLIKRVTPEEAEAIWAEFFPRLLRFAQKKLGDMPCRAFDEEDVALSAINSFFKGRAAGRFEKLSGEDEMWRLLVTITARKITAQQRKHFAEKRGGGKVRGESVFANLGDPSSVEHGLSQIMDKNRMPDTADVVIQTCEVLFKSLKNDKLRRTAIMRMEGYTIQEISDELDCSKARTKQRVTRIKEIWSR